MKSTQTDLIVRSLMVASLALGVATIAQAEESRHAAPWVHRAAYMASADENQEVTIALHLKLRNEAALDQLIKQIYDPASSQYGHFLSPAQFRAQFAPSASDAQTVAETLANFGLRIVPTQSPLYVKAEGTVGQVNAAFQVSQRLYWYKGRTLRASDAAPTLPDRLGDLVSYASVDDTRALVHPLHARPGVDPSAPPGGATSPLDFCSTYWSDHTTSVSSAVTAPYGASGTLPWVVCGYTPQQMRIAYGVNKTQRDGGGVRVGVVDAFASPTIFNDINTYASKHGLPAFTAANFSQIIPSGIYNVPANDPCGPQGWYTEESLDIESVHSIAPGASIVYVGGSDCALGLVEAFYAAINNQVADILTNSYGYDSEDVGLGLIEADLAAHRQAAVEGISLLFSSGDLGDNIPAGNQIAQGSWPATSPFVTAVGGTSLALKNASGSKEEWGWGTYRAVFHNAVIASDGSSVTATGISPFSYYASSGGGTSLVIFQPEYQQGTVPDALATQTALDSGIEVTLLPARRVVPDISMVGDPYTGFVFGMTYTTSTTAINNIGCTPIDSTTEYCERGIGGTSLSSPLFAGLIALVDQQRMARGRGPVGLVTPSLYRVRRGTAGTFTHAVNDIDAPTSPTALVSHRLGASVRLVAINSVPDSTGTAIEGVNTSLMTTPGFDNVTGLGVPYAPALLQALGGGGD